MLNFIKTKLKKFTYLASGIVIVSTSLFPAIKVHAASATLTINGNTKFQTMDGFGTAINGHAWDNGNAKPALDMLVDQNGSSLYRVVMEMTDWESTNDDSNPNNYNWTYYNPIYSGATTFDTAQAGANFGDLWNTIDYLHSKGVPDNQIILSFMGPGPSWNGGNTITTATQENEWAEEVTSAAYWGYTHGHTFGMFSPNNEEDLTGANEGIGMSTSVYAASMNMVATRLDALGLSNLRLLGPEGANPGDIFSYGSTMKNYPNLMAKIDHMDAHSYSGDDGNAPSDAASFGKDFWMSEYTDFNQSFSLINNGASGLMVWEGFDSVYNHAVLNGRGSAPGDDDTFGAAPIAYNSSTKTYTPRQSFYQFSQIFKFVPPGSVRISDNSSNSGIATSAFDRASDGRLTIVGNNTTASSQTITLALNNIANLPASLNYYQTNSTSNLAPGSNVTVSGGTATVTVPANTVFTLTGTGNVDTTAPSTPTNLTATGNLGSASLSWGASTDNVGVSQYNIYRSTTSGFTPGPANKIGQTAGTTYSDNGLGAGTYYYVVTAQDGSGNVSTPSNEASAAVTADTQAPSVNISSPAAGASLSGGVNLSATASDNVAVSGVQFKLDGANIGNELTSAPYTLNWDSATASNGQHTLTAVARDPSGNSTTSSSVNVTVSNTTGPMLLGNQSIQASADSNSSGEAEAFSYTAVASGAAGTLSFYVNSGSSSTMLKVGIYSNNNGHPGTLLASGSLASPKSAAWNSISLSPNAALSSGTTYWIGFLGTGGTLNYRDVSSGYCSESAASTGLTNLPSTWSSGQSWPTCTVSAYVSSAIAGDSTPPSVPTGLNAVPGGVSQVNLSWSPSTDNVGVSGYNVWRNGTKIATTTNTNFTDTGLKSATSYSYTVTAYDAAGNESAQSSSSSATTDSDTVAPTTPTNLTQTGSTATSAAVSWSPSTDNIGVAGYGYYNGALLPLGSTTSTNVTFTGLSCSTSYTIGIDAYDAAGNRSPQATTTINTAACDTTPPSVNISSPTEGSTVFGAVALSANASDNTGVVGVQFKVDGANLGSEVTKAPYSINLDTTTLGNGTHTLTAVARDAAGNTTTSSAVNVSVNNVAAAITLDKQVTTHQSSKSASISSPSLTTTQSNELLVAFITSDGPKTGSQSFSSVTGGGLTWSLSKRVNTQAGTAEIWTAPATSIISNAIVKATRANGSYTGSITVAAFNNANLTTIGAVGGANALSGAPSASLTATQSGSVVWGVGNDWDNAATRTVGSGQTLVDQYIATATGDTFWVQNKNTVNTAGQSVTINDTAPTTDRWNLAIIEILPR